MQALDKSFVGPPKTFYYQKKLENDFTQTQADSSSFTKLTNCSVNTSDLQQARQQVMAAWRQAFPFAT
jgi:hypothetical protein